jgi:hypothetical protein
MISEPTSGEWNTPTRDEEQEAAAGERAFRVQALGCAVRMECRSKARTRQQPVANVKSQQKRTRSETSCRPGAQRSCFKTSGLISSTWLSKYLTCMPGTGHQGLAIEPAMRRQRTEACKPVYLSAALEEGSLPPQEAPYP